MRVLELAVIALVSGDKAGWYCTMLHYGPHIPMQSELYW